MRKHKWTWSGVYSICTLGSKEIKSEIMEYLQLKYNKEKQNQKQ